MLKYIFLTLAIVISAEACKPILAAPPVKVDWVEITNGTWVELYSSKKTFDCSRVSYGIDDDNDDDAEFLNGYVMIQNNVDEDEHNHYTMKVENNNQKDTYDYYNGESKIGTQKILGYGDDYLVVYECKNDMEDGLFWIMTRDVQPNLLALYNIQKVIEDSYMDEDLDVEKIITITQYGEVCNGCTSVGSFTFLIIACVFFAKFR